MLGAKKGEFFNGEVFPGLNWGREKFFKNGRKKRNRRSPLNEKTKTSEKPLVEINSKKFFPPLQERSAPPQKKAQEAA